MVPFRTDAITLIALLLSYGGDYATGFLPPAWHTSSIAGSSRIAKLSFISRSELSSTNVQSTSSPLGPPPQKPGSRPQYNGNRNTGGGQANANRRGAPGPNVLTLQNPLTVQRIVIERPPRPERDNSSDDRPQRQRGEGGPRSGGDGGRRSITTPRPKFSRDSGSDGDSDDSKGGKGGGKPGFSGGGAGRGSFGGDAAVSEKGPKRQFDKTKARQEFEKKKTPLRVQTGRKSRASELNKRRSSLKKRDRSREKAEKDEDDEYDYEDDDTALATGFAMDEDDEEDLVSRPPVVTIMGHVDHGKTSLLDAIRNTKVTAGEAGGITQHIAAYQIEHDGGLITFIDTPGHAAFTDMRERGANMTDIVILVVAADDGVKQQTTDSIVCARQAGVPIMIAINKCDLETADPNRVKTDLAAYDILTEDFGGDVLCSEISAKTGQNLDDLLTKIMLQSELQDLKANPDRDAQGVVVEARMEKGLGAVATTLIQKGTLRVGDAFVAGEASGRVRALIAADGRTRLKEAGPSTPVTVVGLDCLPAAGDLLVVAEDEQLARDLANARQRISRERESESYQTGLLRSVAASFSGGANKEIREMCVVVKADVQGSAEALSRSLSELTLTNEEVEVRVKVLVAEAGDVSKTDIAIASVTPGTTVIAFNIAATAAAMEDARVMGIPIQYYSVVYDAIDSVQSRMQEVLSPTPEGEYVGAAVVQEVFNIGGTGNIAGSRCTDGFIKKGSNVRVMRGDKILRESRVKSLRNFKAEVDSIREGDECGIGLMDYEDFQVGDVIESYVVPRK